MTPEEIDGMPAGPELDALVAQVIGGKYVQSKPWHGWDSEPRVRAVCEFPDGSYLAGTANDWSPSRDVSATWDVLRRISESWNRGRHWAIYDELHRIAEANKSGWPDALIEYGDKVPEWICRAILKASEATL